MRRLNALTRIDINNVGAAGKDVLRGEEIQVHLDVDVCEICLETLVDLRCVHAPMGTAEDREKGLAKATFWSRLRPSGDGHVAASQLDSDTNDSLIGRQRGFLFRLVYLIIALRCQAEVLTCLVHLKDDDRPTETGRRHLDSRTVGFAPVATDGGVEAPDRLSIDA